MSTATNIQAVKPQSLVAKIAGRFSVEPEKLLNTLKATAFKASNEVSNEQMMALLIVADQYGLNPFTKELFAFPDKGGIVPVVSIDGWSRIINDHPQFDGIEFEDGPEAGGTPEWIECVIYRKDRAHPTRIRERFKEVKRDTQPWKSHPSRMLRHKTLIQCARIAFGFSGIYDEDEAQRIVNVTSEAQVVERAPVTSQVRRASEKRTTDDPAVERGTSDGSALEALLQRLKAATDDQQVDVLCTEAEEVLGKDSGGFTAFCQAASTRIRELTATE